MKVEDAENILIDYTKSAGKYSKPVDVEKAVDLLVNTIAELKAENEAYSVEMLNHFYCEASQGGAGHNKAAEYAKMRLAKFKGKG